MTEQAKFFTVEEAAEIMGVSPWTIRRRITDGTIKARRIGRLVRIPKAALEEAGTEI